MRAGGTFPLFYCEIGSFSSCYFPGTAIKVEKHVPSFSRKITHEVCADLIALLTHELPLFQDGFTKPVSMQE